MTLRRNSGFWWGEGDVCWVFLFYFTLARPAQHSIFFFFARNFKYVLFLISSEHSSRKLRSKFVSFSGNEWLSIWQIDDRWGIIAPIKTSRLGIYQMVTLSSESNHTSLPYLRHIKTLTSPLIIKLSNAKAVSTWYVEEEVRLQGLHELWRWSWEPWS